MSSQSGNALQFRILIIGEDSVGKTSLIMRFIHNRFEDSSDKHLEGDIISKKLELFGAPIKLQIQDSSSFDWEQTMSYYIGDADGIMIVLDLASKSKMRPYLDYWLSSVRRFDTEVPIIIVGNKTDLPTKINLKKTVQYISKIGMNLIETSAKTGENVSYAFKLLTSEVVKKKAASKKTSSSRRADGLSPAFNKYGL